MISIVYHCIINKCFVIHVKNKRNQATSIGIKVEKEVLIFAVRIVLKNTIMIGVEKIQNDIDYEIENII